MITPPFYGQVHNSSSSFTENPANAILGMATVVTNLEINQVPEECGLVPVDIEHAGLSTQGELDMDGTVTQSSEQVGALQQVAQPCKDEPARLIEWFRSTFSQVENNGIITRKDFKHTAKKDVSIN